MCVLCVVMSCTHTPQIVASFAASFYLSWELTVVLIGAVPFIGVAGWFMISMWGGESVHEMYSRGS